MLSSELNHSAGFATDASGTLPGAPSVESRPPLFPEPEASPARDTGFVNSPAVRLMVLAVAAGVMSGTIVFSDFNFPQQIFAPVTQTVVAPIVVPDAVPSRTEVPPALPAAVTPAPSVVPPPTAAPALQPAPQPAFNLFQRVQDSDIERAITGMLMAEEQKARLRRQLAADEVQVAWIAVSDSDAQDGDWVTVSGAGYAQNIRLFHLPTSIAVPYQRGVPVTVTGLTDGDGRGITVAVHVRGAQFPLAPMRHGTTVQVPTP